MKMCGLWFNNRTTENGATEYVEAGKILTENPGGNPIKEFILLKS